MLFGGVFQPIAAKRVYAGGFGVPEKKLPAIRGEGMRCTVWDIEAWVVQQDTGSQKEVRTDRVRERWPAAAAGKREQRGDERRVFVRVVRFAKYIKCNLRAIAPWESRVDWGAGEDTGTTDTD